jgi:hypothetical protein
MTLKGDEYRCQICERLLAEDRALPLCDRCEATARAHARLERDAREWERDGKP